MPARASYEVKIEGLLQGLPARNSNGIKAFQELFRQPSESDYTGGLNSTAVWPGGFVINGYEVCRWHPVPQPYAASNGRPDVQPDSTLLSFYAEVTFFAGAALSDPSVQPRLLRDTTWYYEAKRHAWYQDLMQRLDALNNKLPSLDGNRLIEALRFRESRWYCGDGGP